MMMMKIMKVGRQQTINWINM